MLARDIMIKEVITVSRETPVVDVIDILLKNRITGVPVTDEAGNLVGIISESDLIYKEKSLLPLTAYWVNHQEFAEACRKALAAKTEEAMSPDVYSVTEDTSIEDIATLMIEKGIKRVPVVKGRKVVGIITRADVIKAIVAEWPEIIPHSSS